MKLKIALIGTGNIARLHVKPEGDPEATQFEEDEAQYVAAVDLDAQRAKAFADKYGIPNVYCNVDEMLKEVKPHIVLIATPPSAHATLSIKAMEAGAWVLCEKPLCSSLRDLDNIREVEDRTGTFTSSVFQFRFGGAQRHVKAVIESRVVGRPLVGTCHTTWYRPAAYYDVAWRGTWKDELGGPTVGHGIHAMDSFLWTMGPWTEVRAMCATVDRKIEVEDTSSASVLFENGAVGNVLNSILCPHQSTFVRYDLERGTIWTDGALYRLNEQYWRFMTLEEVDEQTKHSFSTITDRTPVSHGAQMKALIADYHAGVRPLVSGDQARQTVEFITSLYKSAATGEPITRGSIGTGDPFYEHVGGTYADASLIGMPA